MWIKIKYFLLKKEDIERVEINSKTGFWDIDYVFTVTTLPFGKKHTITFSTLKAAEDLLDDVHKQMIETVYDSDVIKSQLDDIQKKVSCMSDSSNRPNHLNHLNHQKNANSKRLKRKADEQSC